MIKFFLALFFSTLLPLSVSSQKVEADKSYRIGKLSNGLTYYLKYNAKEKGLAEFFIAQRVGSILEEPRQRGLAHFLEHMAFNGTKNFQGKGKSLGIVPWCETIGVKFGANLNAYTSVDQTVYNISAVPIMREGIIDSTLLILHDWSHFLLLEDNEIDKERGVIHEEWRTRRAGMAIQRMMERVMPTIYKGTKYEDCLPIGSMNIIDNFPYKDLRDYYLKWYRPDLQAIIIVGDIDVDKMEQKIHSVFSDIQKPENPANRIYYPVPDNKKMIVAIDKDSEQPIMLVTLYMKQEATPDSEKDLILTQRKKYLSSLIIKMLNNRLSDIRKQYKPPFHSASVNDGSFFISKTKDAFSVSFGCLQENVKGSFDAVIGEVERARQNGFTMSELQRAKTTLLKSVEHRYAERKEQRNRTFVKKALQNFLDNDPIMSIEYYYKLIQTFNAQITLSEVNKEVAELISNKNQVLTIYAPLKKDFPIADKETFEKYVLDAQSRRYKPYKEKPLHEKLISFLPKKGKIIKEIDWDKFGVKKLILSNGVEVYIKKTSFANDDISMRFYGEGGTSLYPDSDAINFPMLSSAIVNAGVANFDKVKLDRILNGKNVRVSPNVGVETQAINGRSSVNDFETMMQLTYLYFTSPRKDLKQFRSSIETMRSFLKNREANPQVAYNDSVSAILYGNNPRVQPMKRKDLDRISYNRIWKIYTERFSDASAFKMVLVGNVSMEKLRPLLCKYIATLPSKRERSVAKDSYPQVRNVNETHIFMKKMNTPSTLVNIFYTFNEPFNVRTDVALDVLKRVLTIAYTDSVREEKGGTYGVRVQSRLDNTSKPRGLLKISFRTDPKKYEMLIPIIYKQIENIAKKGPLKESLSKVKAYLIKAYNQSIQTNDYWDYVIYNRLRHNIDFFTDYNKIVNNITLQDIQLIAKDILKSDRRIEITMISE